MSLFGVGLAEAGVIAVLILVLVGPHRFPEIMREAGRWYRLARRYTDEVMKDIRTAVDELEREVEQETEDLRSVGELADVTGELAGDRKEDSVAQSAAAEATESAADGLDAPAIPSAEGESVPGPDSAAGHDPTARAAADTERTQDAAEGR